MGNGATIHKMPLINILALSGTTAPMTILIHDCTKHMEEGGKKDVRYIAELFEGKVLEYNPQLLCTDVFYFDGASNVQKAGEILMAKFPCSFCFHGGEHVVSLFFSSIAKIKPIKVHGAGLSCILVETFFNQILTSYLCPVLIPKTCRIYHVFGSGASHAIYAQFMAQLALANRDRGWKVCLIQGAGT
jgi:hypothetical protein